MTPGDVVADRFVVGEWAGEGGMGVVYKATDQTGGNAVALKQLTRTRRTDLSRFDREVQILVGIEHPRIVRYVAHGTHEQTPWLAMEWVEGEDLQKRLEREALSVSDSLTVVCGIAEALAVAHEQGITHRDIKPANVILAGGDVQRSVVLDFGVARADALVAPGATVTGAAVGTPAYMSPEQARGDADVDASADVFSLGCVLFECLTGKPPFFASSAIAVLARVLLEDVPRLRSIRPGLPAALDEVLARMLDKDPVERPPDGRAALSALLDLGDIEGDRPETEIVEAESLTASERVLLSVVAAARPSSARALDDTLAPEDEAEWLRRASEVATRFGGLALRLADGSLVVTFRAAGIAQDQAQAAARCALALTRALPDRAFGVGTGRGVVDGPLPVGEALDGACGLLGETVGKVHVDELTAGLLGERFDVAGDERGLVLLTERAAPPLRTLLGQPTPCVGRRVELATLSASWEESSEDSVARGVLVVGGAGSGKTRLRQELVTRVDVDEPWMARGDPLATRSAYATLGDLVRRLAGLAGGEDGEVLRKKLRARVGRHAPSGHVERITEFLGEAVSPWPCPVSDALAAARHDARLLRDQMRAALTELLHAECRREPTLVVLEDAHWADPPSLGLFAHAFETLTELPLMLMVTARPDAPAHFDGLGGFQRLELGLLSNRAAEKLARAALGNDVEDAVVKDIVERSGGHPIWLEELIRAQAEGAGTDAPSTVVAMIGARLEALSPRLRRTLRAASVFGRGFWVEGVSVLTNSPKESLGIEELLERELVSPCASSRFVETHELTFRHALTRDAAYAMLNEEDKQLGHRLAARWLQQAGESDPALLAEHLELSDQPKEAVPHYREAAERAVMADDHEGALRCGQRAQACGAHGSEYARVRVVEARIHGLRGRSKEGLKAGAAAMREAPEGSAPFFDGIRYALVFARRAGELERWLHVAHELPDIPAAEGAASARARAVCQAVGELLLTGRGATAGPLLEEMTRIAEGELDPALEATLEETLAIAALTRGDTGAYLRHMRALLEIHTRTSNRPQRTVAHVNFGYAANQLGAWDLAEEALAVALVEAERAGASAIRAGAMQNLGWTYARQGDVARGLRLIDASADAFEEYGEALMGGASHTLAARLRLETGAYEAAANHARIALEVLADEPAARCYAMATRAEIERTTQRCDDAVETSAAACAMLDDLGAIEEGEAFVRLARARALRDAGEAAADDALTEAVARLHERASAIEDEELRKSFLESVPENRDTLAMLSNA